MTPQQQALIDSDTCSQFIAYLTNAQFGLLTAGVAGVTYQITDVVGWPQYRWNGTALVQIGNGTSNPSFTGVITSTGSFVQTPYTIVSSQINVAGGEGVVNLSVDTIFTFIGAPVSGEYFSARITNTDTLSHLISFPSCVDMITGLTVSTSASRLTAGAVHTYIFQYDGTVYRLYSNTSAAGPQVNMQSVNYTTTLADANNIVEHPATDVTARTFTLDTNVNVAYPIGTKIVMPNQVGAGAVTVAVAGTDTINLTGTATAGNRTVAAGGCAICLKVGSTAWQVGGPGVT